MQQYVLSILFGLLSILILYVIGHIIIYKERTNSSTFMKIVVGVISFTTGYALIVSEFSSYLLIALFLSVFFLIKNGFFETLQNTKKIFQNLIEIPLKKEMLRKIIPFYIISFFIFTGYHIPHLDNSLQVNFDYTFYATISDILNITGIESKLIDLAMAGENHFVFYHYFELWFNSALTETFGFTSLYTLIFILIPMLITILFIGVFEYLQDFYPSYKDKYWISLALSTSIVFLFPYTLTLRWVISLGSDFHPWNTTIASPVHTTIKWSIVAIGLLYLIRSYNQNGLKNLPLIFGFITVAYPTTMVTIIPSLFVWGFYLLYCKRKEAARDTFWIIGRVVLSMLLVLFKGALPEIAKTEIGTLEYLLYYFKEDYSRLLIFIKEPLLRSAYVLIAFFPILLTLGLKYKKNDVIVFFNDKKPLIVFFFIAYVLSLLGICLLNFSYDGDQIHTNLFYPLYILLVFFAFIDLFFSAAKLRAIAIGLFVLTVSINIYGLVSRYHKYPKQETENRSEIIKTLEQNDGQIVFINSEDSFKSGAKHPQSIIPNPNLRFYVNDYFPKALSLDKIKIENLMDLHYLEQGIKTSKFYNDILIEKFSYKEVIEQNKGVKILIIDKRAPEYINAEQNYNAERIGLINEYVYYKIK